MARSGNNPRTTTPRGKINTGYPSIRNSIAQPAAFTATDMKPVMLVGAPS